MKAQILHCEGANNGDMAATIKRLDRAKMYADLSTVAVCPSRGKIAVKVISAWQGLQKPMNQSFYGPIFAVGLEVGDAYNQLMEVVLAHPDLRKCKYLLTVEEDNCPPQDGLLKLYEAIEGGVNGRRYDVVGGLYFTKGEAGQPMIYGDPREIPRSFKPIKPVIGQLVEANALGMGFNLFRMSIFKKVPKPWFKTLMEKTDYGMKCMTQDLYFYEKAAQVGCTFACDCRCLVGHYDFENDMMY